MINPSFVVILRLSFINTNRLYYIMREMKMKKTVITLQICIVLIIASFSSIAGASIQEKTNSDQEESLQTTQVTMNIHTLSGREKRTIDIPISFLNNPSEPLSFEEIISYLSEEDQTYVKQLMERDIQKLTTLFSQRNRPQNILLNKESNLFKKLIFL